MQGGGWRRHACMAWGHACKRAGRIMLPCCLPVPAAATSLTACPLAPRKTWRHPARRGKRRHDRQRHHPAVASGKAWPCADAGPCGWPQPSPSPYTLCSLHPARFPAWRLFPLMTARGRLLPAHSYFHLHCLPPFISLLSRHCLFSGPCGPRGMQAALANCPMTQAGGGGRGVQLGWLAGVALSITNRSQVAQPSWAQAAGGTHRKAQAGRSGSDGRGT